MRGLLAAMFVVAAAVVVVVLVRPDKCVRCVLGGSR